MYNNGTKKEFNKNRKTREEYEAEKAALLEKQKANLGIISEVAGYLNGFIQDATMKHVTMKEVLAYLEEKQYNTEETKGVSQFSYLLMELANCRKNPHFSEDRLNIRVLYIEERLKTSFKRELHDDIRKIIEKYNDLFQWEDDATGENYETLTEEKE